MSKLVVLFALLQVALSYKYGIPFYRYPDGQWDIVTGLDSVDLVIFNPNSGPGTAVNSDYVARVNALKNAGQLVGGYVHTSYGSRDINLVFEEIDAYFSWYPTIDGVFVDEVASAGTQQLLDYYRQIKNYVRAKGTRKGIVLNHGTIPDEAYMDIADIDCIFEGPLSAYTSFAASLPAWVHNYPPEKFWHIVHTSPYESNNQVVSILQATNAHWLYVTDLTMPNPYDSLPRWAVAPPSPPAASTGASLPPPPPATVQLGLQQVWYPGGSAEYATYRSAFSLDSPTQVATDAVLGFTMITPATGPGNAANSDYQAEVQAVQRHGGLVLGYIYTSNGGRALEEIRSEIDRYYEFYNVDGFYLDQTWSMTVEYANAISSYAKGAVNRGSSPGLTLLGYHDEVANGKYRDVADIFQIFSGTAAEFVAFEPAAWTRAEGPHRFYAFVSETSEAQLDAVIEHAESNNIGYLYATNTGTWTLPSYFETFVDKLHERAVPTTP